VRNFSKVFLERKLVMKLFKWKSVIQLSLEWYETEHFNGSVNIEKNFLIKTFFNKQRRMWWQILLKLLNNFLEFLSFYMKQKWLAAMPLFCCRIEKTNTGKVCQHKDYKEKNWLKSKPKELFSSFTSIANYLR